MENKLLDLTALNSVGKKCSLDSAENVSAVLYCSEFNYSFVYIRRTCFHYSILLTSLPGQRAFAWVSERLSLSMKSPLFLSIADSKYSTRFTPFFQNYSNFNCWLFIVWKHEHFTNSSREEDMVYRTPEPGKLQTNNFKIVKVFFKHCHCICPTTEQHFC